MRVHLIVLALAATFLGTKARTQTIDCSHRTAEDFVPMSRTDRAADYVRSLSGPEAFLYAGTLAGIDHGVNRPREWGQGSLGYTRRFANASAENIIGNTLQHGLALGWTRITGTSLPASAGWRAGWDIRWRVHAGAAFERIAVAF